MEILKAQVMSQESLLCKCAQPDQAESELSYAEDVARGASEALPPSSPSTDQSFWSPIEDCADLSSLLEVLAPRPRLPPPSLASSGWSPVFLCPRNVFPEFRRPRDVLPGVSSSLEHLRGLSRGSPLSSQCFPYVSPVTSSFCHSFVAPCPYS